MIYVNEYVFRRDVVSLYVEHEKLRDKDGFLEPIEAIPGDQVHLSYHVDISVSAANPKTKQLTALIRQIKTLVKEAETLEKGGVVRSEPYITKMVEPSKYGLSLLEQAEISKEEID